MCLLPPKNSQSQVFYVFHSFWMSALSEKYNSHIYMLLNFVFRKFLKPAITGLLVNIVLVEFVISPSLVELIYIVFAKC